MADQNGEGIAASLHRGAPTVHDVARHAGVSPMTVSRVLSGGKNVRDEMKAKVDASVRALGYRRNENARSIRPGHTTGLIGVAVTNIANPYYAGVVLGIEEVVNEHHRRILVGNTNEDVAREGQLVEDFIGRQVEGLILVPSGPNLNQSSPLVHTPFPVVLASRALPGLEADTVLLDDVNGSMRGTGLLLDEGHRRIAFLGNLLSVSTGRRRYEGFVQAHRDRNLPVDERLVRRGQQDVVSAQNAMADILDQPSPPTAVFTANNRNTIGAVRALEASGRFTDHTFRIVAFDNFELAEIIPYQLTIIDHDPREMGRQAATLLLARIESANSDQPMQSIELPTTLLA
jgi:LacI family transcriptional regulator